MSKYKWHLKGWLSPSCITAKHRRCDGFLGDQVDKTRRCGCECHAPARVARARQLIRLAGWDRDLVPIEEQLELLRPLP